MIEVFSPYRQHLLAKLEEGFKNVVLSVKKQLLVIILYKTSPQARG